MLLTAELSFVLTVLDFGACISVCVFQFLSVSVCVCVCVCVCARARAFMLYDCAEFQNTYI